MDEEEGRLREDGRRMREKKDLDSEIRIPRETRLIMHERNKEDENRFPIN